MYLVSDIYLYFIVYKRNYSRRRHCVSYIHVINIDWNINEKKNQFFISHNPQKYAVIIKFFVFTEEFNP